MILAIGLGVVSTLLVLRVQAEVPAGELSEMQNAVIRSVTEKFHQRDLINGYKMASVEKAAEEAYLAGMFVHVEFLIKQTSCPKSDWSKAHCQAARNAKTYNCFGCYKFAYETHKILSYVEECVLLRHMHKGRQARRADLCKEVAKKDAGKNVGQYSFLRSE